MIKEVDKNFRDTVIDLDGNEAEVRFSAKYSYFALMNNSDDNVIMSLLSGKSDSDDGVRIVLPGASAVIAAPGMSDRIFVQGTGRVQISAMTDPICPFKQGARGGDNSGGGGESQDIICGTAEYVGGGIKSIPVVMSGSIEESFAAALAAETGWELQPDGVSVLKDDEVGFRFVNRSPYHFVCLVNNMRNDDSDYLDNLQYLQNTGISYYMDVCYSPSGAVAFGFRLENETPKLTFVMTKDGNGDSVCMATYYQNTRLEWCKKGDTSVRAIKDDPLRALGAGSSILGLFKLADGYSGRTFKDCYCVYWVNNVLPLPGSVVSIDGNRFAIVYNHIYNKDDQVWLAIPLN